MEQKWLGVSLEDIEKSIEELKQKIEGVPTKFVFNFNKVGYEKYSDANEMYAIVPADYKNHMMLTEGSLGLLLLAISSAISQHSFSKLANVSLILLSIWSGAK